MELTRIDELTAESRSGLRLRTHLCSWPCHRRKYRFSFGLPIGHRLLAVAARNILVQKDKAKSHAGAANCVRMWCTWGHSMQCECHA